MARTSTVTTQTTISSTWANALITDYVSQTDTSDQDLASDIEIVSGKELRTNTISETTAASGVTIDGCLIKDGLVDGLDVSGLATSAQAVAAVEAEATLDLTGDVTIAAAKSLAVDTISEKTGAAGVIIDSLTVKDGEIDFAAGKRPKADFIYMNPTTAPAATEGHIYYDSTADKLKLRNASAWVDIPAATGGGGGASHGPYTYIVYLDGADCYAEDWEGNLVYGGPSDAGGIDGGDADAVLQAVLNVGAVHAFVKAGTYPLGTKLSITAAGTVVEGEGDLTLFTVTGNDAFYNIYDYCILRNFKISGNGAAGGYAAIEQRNADNCLYERLTIINPSMSGIKIRALAGASPNYNVIKNCYVDLQGSDFTLNHHCIEIGSDVATGIGNMILNCWALNADDTGINVFRCDYMVVQGNVAYVAYNDCYGINSQSYLVFNDNIAYQGSNSCIWIADEPAGFNRDVKFCTFSNNILIEGANAAGTKTGSMSMVVYGYNGSAIEYNVIQGNTFNTTGLTRDVGAGGKGGLYFIQGAASTVQYNIADSNTFFDVDGGMVRLAENCNYNKVTNNVGYYVRRGIMCDGEANEIVGNTIWSPLASANALWLEANAVNNILQRNKADGFTDSGTGTIFNKKIISFVDGTSAEDSGWDIDAAAEYARVYAYLPEHLAKIVNIRIYARSIVTEAHAMELDITANGGASNEAYNTEAISVTSKGSETTNFAADDIIYWEIDGSDDSDIGDLTGGDSVELKVIYAGADGDNCATDARFRTVEISYV